MATSGFRLGIYVFKDVEILDFAAPHGVLSSSATLRSRARGVPRRRCAASGAGPKPVSLCCLTIPSQTGPRWTPSSSPEASALARRSATAGCTSSSVASRTRRCSPVCARVLGSTPRWGCSTASPRPAVRNPTGVEANPPGKVPIDRLAEIAPACRISRARVVDAGRIVTAGGIASGMELGFQLLRRAGYAEDLIGEVARVMEYQDAYQLYLNDLETV